MEKKKAQLQTERLVLKVYEEWDRSRMLEILYDETVKKTYMIPDFADIQQANALFEKMMQLSRDHHRFVYGIYLENELIGFVNDCEIEGATVELGYVIAPAYQRNGYATEALGACIEELFRMGYQQVKAGFFEENIASCRVMQKCGMWKMAFEEEIEYKGVLHHCIYYAVENSRT